jgi:hypothetical protein
MLSYLERRRSDVDPSELIVGCDLPFRQFTEFRSNYAQLQYGLLVRQQKTITFQIQY